jgi:hypothetical protein
MLAPADVPAAGLWARGGQEVAMRGLIAFVVVLLITGSLGWALVAGCIAS